MNHEATNTSKLHVVVLLTFIIPSTFVFAEKPKRLLLLGQQPDGHPEGTHEYMPGQKILASCLKDVEGLETKIVQADGDWIEGPDLIKEADGVVLFVSEGAKWVSADPRRLDAFTQLAARKGGFVVLHWGMGTRAAEPIESFLKLFGGCHGGPDRKYTVVENAEFQIPNPNHPIVAGVASFRVPREEFYYRLKWVKTNKEVMPIVRVPIGDTVETVGWAWQRGDGGRSFGFSGLHFHDNWRHLQYRRMIAQAALWSIDLPVPKEGLKDRTFAQ